MQPLPEGIAAFAHATFAVRQMPRGFVDLTLQG